MKRDSLHVWPHIRLHFLAIHKVVSLMRARRRQVFIFRSESPTPSSGGQAARWQVCAPAARSTDSLQRETRRGAAGGRRATQQSAGPRRAAPAALLLIKTTRERWGDTGIKIRCRTRRARRHAAVPMVEMLSSRAAVKRWQHDMPESCDRKQDWKYRLAGAHTLALAVTETEITHNSWLP